MATNLQSKAFTCRQYSLNPIGCLMGASCPFSHSNTGKISPPSTITCWSWKYGGCRYHQDGCLFAHYDTGLLQTSAFSSRHRPLRGKDRVIAMAAARTGFDCSDVDRLMTLVNAVRDAEAGTSYPDYYKGASLVESEFGPARRRQRKGVLQSYRDADNPAVPAFGLTPNQILRGMCQFGPGGDFMSHTGTNIVETSNVQTINLYNKRSSGDSYRPTATKRIKTTSSPSMTARSHVTIYLTQDDDVPAGASAGSYVHPSRAHMVPVTKSSQCSTTYDQIIAAQRAPSRAQSRAENQENSTRIATAKAFARISGILSTQMAQIGSARNSLKKRWDDDRHLQLQSVTEELAELNSFFNMMENAGRDALQLIQDKLMR